MFGIEGKCILSTIPPPCNINTKATMKPPLCLLAAAIASHITNGEECITPPTFTGASPKSTIYVIMNIITGDFFAQLIDGMKQQAALVGESGVNMKIVSADMVMKQGKPRIFYWRHKMKLPSEF